MGFKSGVLSLPRNVENKRYFKTGKKLYKLSFLSSFMHWICVTNNLTLYYIYQLTKTNNGRTYIVQYVLKKRINRYPH